MFVLVGGWPGSGKTTLSRALAAELGVAYLAKDEIKAALMDELGSPTSVGESRRLGRAAVQSDVFTPLERDVMEYAEAMSQTPPTVTDVLSAGLLQALGAPALIELTAYVTMANMAARMNVAIGPFGAQGLAEGCGLRPLAEPSSSAEGIASRS